MMKQEFEIYYDILYRIISSGGENFESFVKMMLVFEILFLLFITSLGIVIRLIRDHIKVKRKQFKNEIHKKIEKNLIGNREPRSPYFNRKLRSPTVLVPVLESFDHFYQSKRWSELKRSIIQKYLLVKARRYSKSGSWKKRNFALRIYQLDLSLFPEKWIIDSLEDDLPLNQIHAALCVGKLGSQESVKALLGQLTHAGRFGRLAFEDALVQGNSEARQWVKERYLNDQDPEIRRVCLNILSQKIESGIIEQIEKDLKGDDLELRLAATRALGSQPSEKALVLLSELVLDDSWILRATTIKSLGHLADQRVMPLLAKGLSDKNWWVRLNSAMALLDFEERGIRILKMQDPEVDNYAYEMARYVLALRG